MKHFSIKADVSVVTMPISTPMSPGICRAKRRPRLTGWTGAISADEEPGEYSSQTIDFQPVLGRKREVGLRVHHPDQRPPV